MRLPAVGLQPCQPEQAVARAETAVAFHAFSFLERIKLQLLSLQVGARYPLHVKRQRQRFPSGSRTYMGFLTEGACITCLPCRKGRMAAQSAPCVQHEVFGRRAYHHIVGPVDRRTFGHIQQHRFVVAEYILLQRQRRVPIYFHQVGTSFQYALADALRSSTEADLFRHIVIGRFDYIDRYRPATDSRVVEHYIGRYQGILAADSLQTGLQRIKCGLAEETFLLFNQAPDGQTFPVGIGLDRLGGYSPVVRTGLGRAFGKRKTDGKSLAATTALVFVPAGLLRFGNLEHGMAMRAGAS